MIYCPLEGLDIVVTQSFGANPAHYALYGLKAHNGTDMRCPIGTPLYAACEGYVHYGDNGTKGYGKFLTITSLPYMKDGTCREITLGHLSRFIMGLEGQYVHSGDLVGISGNTGDSSAPHVHLTYKKLDATGKILNEDNGYKGAIDVSPYIQMWTRALFLKT